MLKLTLAALTAAISCLTLAQVVNDYAPSIQNSASNKEDHGIAVAYDSTGGTILTGTSEYTLGGGTRHAIWTMRLTNLGLVDWAVYGRAGLNGENDFAKAIVVDGFGNTYVAAEGNWTALQSRMLLIKYTSTGVIQWARFFIPKPGVHNVPVGVGLDIHNRPYMAGTTGDGVGTDYSVCQYSGGGILNWHKEFDLSGGSDDCAAMKVLPSGDVFLAGSSQPASGAVTSWVVKYDSAGNKKWDSGITNDSAVIYQTHGLDVAKDGTVAVTGSNFPIDTEFFAALFNPAGTYQWTRTYNPVSSAGFPDQIGGNAVAIGKDGSVYATGAVQDIGGYFEGAVVKWDLAGTQKFAKTFGTPSNQTRGVAIRVDDYERVYIGYENSKDAFSYRQAGIITYNGVSGVSIASALSGSGSTLNSVGGINIDSRGRIYFTGTNKLVPNSANMVTTRYVQPIVSMNRGISLKHDTSVHLSVAQGAFLNARYYVDGTAVLVSGTTHGNLTLASDGAIDYTPNPGFIGTDTFTFRGLQRGMNGNIATVNFFVNP